jgi:hypothetical protein
LLYCGIINPIDIIVGEMDNGREESGYRFESRASEGELEAILVPTLKKIVRREEWHLGTFGFSQGIGSIGTTTPISSFRG